MGWNGQAPVRRGRGGAVVGLDEARPYGDVNPQRWSERLLWPADLFE
jgi:hypothetical protein